MQLSNSTSTTFAPKARSTEKLPLSGQGTAQAGKTYREASNDEVYQYPGSINQVKTSTERPVGEVNRTEKIYSPPVYKYQDPKTLPGYARAAISTYHGVAEAMPPQKVELLGIDIFA